MNNKKIIFFSRDLKIGGMEKALVVLLNNLAKDYNITLVLENKQGDLLNNLNPKIKVTRYSLSKCKVVIIRKIFNLLHRIFWAVFNYHKYAFSCNYATYSVIGSRLANIASKNSSLYIHSDYYNYFKRQTDEIITFFEQEGIKELEHLIFVSNESMKNIENIFPSYKHKFCVISNLIDYNEVINSNKELEDIKKPNNKELLVFVGRLEEESKRLTRLFESFKKVVSEDSNYELWIIGNGKDFDNCMSLVKKANLSENVKFLGEKVNPYPYISNADCVVMTSDFEGFPIIYNECLCLKIPVLTTIPVSDEHLDYRNYSVLVKKDSQDIAEKLLKKSYKDITFDSVDITKINTDRLNSLKKIIDN